MMSIEHMICFFFFFYDYHAIEYSIRSLILVLFSDFSFQSYMSHLFSGDRTLPPTTSNTNPILSTVNDLMALPP